MVRVRNHGRISLGCPHSITLAQHEPIALHQQPPSSQSFCKSSGACACVAMAKAKLTFTLATSDTVDRAVVRMVVAIRPRRSCFSAGQNTGTGDRSADDQETTSQPGVWRRPGASGEAEVVNTHIAGGRAVEKV